jgi:hypothetical protein
VGNFANYTKPYTNPPKIRKWMISKTKQTIYKCPENKEIGDLKKNTKPHTNARK